MAEHVHHHLQHDMGDDNTGIVALMVIVLLIALLGIGAFLYAQNVTIRREPVQETPGLNMEGELVVPVPESQY